MLRGEEVLKVSSLVHSASHKETLAVYSGRQVPSISIDRGLLQGIGAIGRCEACEPIHVAHRADICRRRLRQAASLKFVE
jgi:recombinational DNA repair protein RecR